MKIKINVRDIEYSHLQHVREVLIKNGASKDITDDQVKNTCGFNDSLRSYTHGFYRGWGLAESLDK